MSLVVTRHSKQLTRRALLDQVALIVTKFRVLCWGEGVARGRRHAGVALSNLTRVLIVCRASSTQEESCFDASAAHLDSRCVWVIDVLRRKFTAHTQSTLAGTIAQDWLVLNVDLLVVVQRQLLLGTKGGRRSDQSSKDCCTDLHCRWTEIANAEIELAT